MHKMSRLCHFIGCMCVCYKSVFGLSFHRKLAVCGNGVCMCVNVMAVSCVYSTHALANYLLIILPN